MFVSIYQTIIGIIAMFPQSNHYKLSKLKIMIET